MKAMLKNLLGCFETKTSRSNKSAHLTLECLEDRTVMSVMPFAFSVLPPAPAPSISHTAVNTFGQPVYNTTPVNTFGQPVHNTTPVNTFGQPVHNTTPVNTFGQPVHNTTPVNTFGQPVHNTTPVNTFGQPVQSSMPEGINHVAPAASSLGWQDNVTVPSPVSTGWQSSPPMSTPVNTFGQPVTNHSLLNSFGQPVETIQLNTPETPASNYYSNQYGQGGAIEADSSNSGSSGWSIFWRDVAIGAGVGATAGGLATVEVGGAGALPGAGIGAVLSIIPAAWDASHHGSSQSSSSGGFNNGTYSMPASTPTGPGSFDNYVQNNPNF